MRSALLLVLLCTSRAFAGTPVATEEDCDPRCPASRDATIPPLRGPTPTTITTPKDPPPPGETTAAAQLIAQHWSAQPLHPPGEAPPPTLLHDSLCALGLGAGLFLLFGGGDWLLRLWRRRRTRSGTAIHLWPLALLALALGGCTVPEGDWAGLVIFGLLCAATAAAQRP